MTGENLYDQGGAGTRQSHDEDRIRRRAACAFAFAENLRREERLRASQMIAGCLRIEGDPSFAQGIAFLVVPERLGKITFVFQRFAEREVQMPAILDSDLLARELRA